MKQENKIFLMVLIAISILFTFSGVYIFNLLQEVNYCIEKYPSQLDTSKHNYGSTRNVEPGYIECCRDYYENHEIKKECRILKYKK